MNLRQSVKDLLRLPTSKKGADSGRQSVSVLDTHSSSPLRNMSGKEYLGLYTSRVFACVQTIADDVSALEYKLLDPKNNAINHEYLGMLKSDMIRYIVAYLKLSGSAYIWKVGNGTGRKVYSLQLLRPDLVTAERNRSRTKIQRYIYSYAGQQIPLQPEEVIAIHNFNPFETLGMQSRGYGDVQAASLSISNEVSGETWNWKFFENANYPGATLSTEQNLESEERERIQESREQKYKGVNNAHKLAILSNGLKLDRPSPHQKEADFVQQQRFSFEKILAIFRVPKAKLGMGEGVNVGNVKAFEIIFARGVVRPLAKKIAEKLSKELFNGIGKFEFINVVPFDEEELRKDYLSGLISRNEYRVLTGMPRIIDGDVLNDSTPIVIEQEKGPKEVEKTRITPSPVQHKIALAVRKASYGSEDRAEDRRSKKIVRQETYEKTYKSTLARIRELQSEDILKQFDKNSKSVRMKLPSLDPTKWLTVWFTLWKPIQLSLLSQEGIVAMQEVAPDKTFDPLSAAMKKIATDNIRLFSRSIDETTGKEIGKVIETGLNAGLTPVQVREKLVNYFGTLTEKRADIIVRTETIRAGTIAQQQAREQSGVVKEKIRYTAVDERVCERCGPQHGKKVALKDNFYDKGDEITGTNGGVMKLDHWTTLGSPLHPHCRCDMIAVLK